MTTVLNGVMRSMHLPEAIEVSAGSGVPPSILQKAAEIRVKGRDPHFAHLECPYRMDHTVFSILVPWIPDKRWL